MGVKPAAWHVWPSHPFVISQLAGKGKGVEHKQIARLQFDTPPPIPGLVGGHIKTRGYTNAHTNGCVCAAYLALFALTEQQSLSYLLVFDPLCNMWIQWICKSYGIHRQVVEPPLRTSYYGGCHSVLSDCFQHLFFKSKMFSVCSKCLPSVLSACVLSVYLEQFSRLKIFPSVFQMMF